jgi:hypothetical protein
LYGLSLLTLPALAPHGVQALPRTRPPGSGSDLRSAEIVPYLPKLGAPRLRFQEATPPPDLVTRPAAGAPPVPPLSPTESTVAIANAEAARSAPATDPPPDPPPSAAAPATTGPAASAPAGEAPAKPVPAPILPDNVRPAVRPEDFLPFFQIPGAGRNPAGVSVLAPVPPGVPPPASLPASSANYRQTP